MPFDPVVYQREYRKRNKNRIRKQQSEAHLRRAYGLTVEQWSEMITAGCGICGTSENLVVDHNHRTGVVRGVLCMKHNCGLGYFDDDPDTLMRAIQWIEEHRSVDL